MEIIVCNGVYNIFLIVTNNFEFSVLDQKVKRVIPIHTLGSLIPRYIILYRVFEKCTQF